MTQAFDRLVNAAMGLLRWLAQRPGVMMLTAEDEELFRQSPRRFSRAWLDVMLLSLAWGLAAVQVWGFTWRVFGDFSGILLVPASAVLAVMALWLYRRCFLALAEAVCPQDTHRALAAAVICVVMVLVLLGLRSWNADYPTYLPPRWQWIRPRTMFRALMLAPLWGGWAMLVACQLGKPADSASPPVVAFVRGCTLLATCAVLAVVMSATIIYFNHLPWRQVSISLVAMGTAVAGGPLLSRRRGGLDRDVLLATNLLTQLAFLLAYLANRNP
jgi:hypothetical protein